MRHLHQFIIVLALVLMGQSASAYDFMVDGIAYNVLSEPSNGSMGCVGVTSTIWISTDVFNHPTYGKNYSDLEEAIIPESIEHDGKTYQVTEVLNTAFAYSYITHVLIPNTVTKIGSRAFRSCTHLEEISFPESVTELGESCCAFSAIEFATILGALEIPSYAFDYCKNLKTVEMPNVYGTINFAAFRGCSNLRSVVIPDGVTQVRQDAFKDCASLESIHLGKSVESIGNNSYLITYQNTEHAANTAFTNCPELTQITVSPENPYFDSRDDCNAVVTTEDNFMILACKNTVIPSSVKVVFNAFIDVPGLKHIDIPETVKTIYGSFVGIKDVEHIVIPEGIERIYQSFTHCGDLKSVKISSTVNSCNHSFKFCPKLESIVVSEENVTYDSRENCNAIIYTTGNSLIIGCKTTIIPETITYIASGAFSGCSGMVSIHIPSSVIEIKDAFLGCSNLRVLRYDPISIFRVGLISIVKSSWGPFEDPIIGKSPFVSDNSVVQLDSVIFGPEVVSIPDNFLWGQQHIKYLELPPNLIHIGQNAFGNSCIEEIVIPENMNYIGKLSFSNTTLKNVYCLSPDPDIAETEQVSDSTYTPFDGIPTNSVLHVPHGRKEIFQQHPGWNSFKEIYELTDVNCDNLTDIADVNQVINVMLGKAEQTSAGDVNGDGVVDISDVNMVINAMLGK